MLIGGGPHQPVIQRYAQEIGVASHCTFTGRIPDEALCRILSSADIAIDPDPKNDWTDKSTMNKIVEYMFFGLPIVCYDLREARVSADPAARYVEANNEDALAEGSSISRPMPPAQARMRAFGMDRVRRALAWDYSVPPLLAAYEKARASVAPGTTRIPPSAAISSCERREIEDVAGGPRACPRLAMPDPRLAEAHRLEPLFRDHQPGHRASRMAGGEFHLHSRVCRQVRHPACPLPDLSLQQQAPVDHGGSPSHLWLDSGPAPRPRQKDRLDRAQSRAP